MLCILDINLYLYGLQIFPIYRLPFQFVDYFLKVSQVALVVKKLSASAEDVREVSSSLWGRKELDTTERLN